MATISRAVHLAAYRPDIDGLRAIAVVAVLMFHAFPRLFPGGFIGVDVFFVISGFLITGNINRGIETGSFTIGGFYLRRVRRIFPALLIVLACCLIAGRVFFTPSEFMQLGKHTGAAAAFASNFFYWAESGYFDGAAITKPLLHLWSLGIEEQFYLLWPLFIVVSHRKGKSRESILIVILISFVACLWTTAPQSSGAFYSPVTRMWELALGGVLALAAQKGEEGSAIVAPGDWNCRPPRVAELCSFGGIALLLAAVWVYDGATLYPGWRALLPTLGAGLVIAAGRSAFLNRRVLSHPAMVFVGLISYPLYLWHWPLLSFAHIITLGVVPIQLTIGLLVASVILATGTYMLLEQPVHRSLLSWGLAGWMVAIMACLGAVGVVAYASGGRNWSAHSAADIAASRSSTLHSDDKAAPPQPPSPTSPDLDPIQPNKPIEGEQEHLAAATKVTLPKGDAATGPPTRSRLMLYRQRVSEAMDAAGGNPDAYLVEMGKTRLKAVRSGICDADGTAVESPNGLRDESVCGKPVDGAKNVMVLGDSIASDTYAWLHTAYPEYNIIQKTGPGCNLMLPVKTEPKPCAAMMKSAIDMALSPTEKVDAVVLVSLWNIASPKDLGEADPFIDQLLARGRNVVLIGPPVGFTVQPRELIDKCPSSSKDGLTPAELEDCARKHSTVFREPNKAMKQYAQQKGKGLPYVDLHDLTCNDSECPVLDDEGQLMFTDTWHRSFPGLTVVARRVRKDHVFERILDVQ